MTVTYDTTNRLKALSPVLDEFAEWYGNVIRALFYPESYEDASHLAPPDSFPKWLEEAKKDDTFSSAVFKDMEYGHAELLKHGGIMTKYALESKKRPELEFFDDFVSMYDGFILSLRRLEYDIALSNSGIDPLSGLRSRKAMNNDLERELERLARRGKPFCLALAYIDNYQELEKSVSKERDIEILQQIAGLIKQCLRTFDDAYRSDSGEFIMSLKQAEMAGGTAAVNRLRNLLKNANIQYEVGGETRTVTMSFCVSEPLPDDTVEDLLKNMRADLKSYDDNGDTALEFVEQSPLQRYVKSVDN